MPKSETRPNGHMVYNYDLASVGFQKRQDDLKHIIRAEDQAIWLTRMGVCGRNIIEIGPGSGLFTQTIQTLNPTSNVIGIELSTSTSKLIKKLSPDLKIINGSGFNLPFEDKSISLVCLLNVIHLFNNKKLTDLFNEIKRVLSPDGHIYFTTSLHYESEKMKKISKLKFPDSPTRMRRKFTYDEILKTVYKNGFTLKDSNIEYGSSQELDNYGWGRFVFKSV